MERGGSLGRDEQSRRAPVDPVDLLPRSALGDAAAAVELARGVNEAGAQITSARPNRFGFFAALPLPEIDAAVTEIRYALDDLGAIGNPTPSTSKEASPWQWQPSDRPVKCSRTHCRIGGW